MTLLGLWNGEGRVVGDSNKREWKVKRGEREERKEEIVGEMRGTERGMRVKSKKTVRWEGSDTKQIAE